MPLPSSATQPELSLEKTYWLVFGNAGVGKSSFAASFPNAVFFTTERAHRHLSIFERQITSWDDFKMAAAELRTKDGVRFNNIIVDTVDLLYRFCLEQTCKENDMEHPSDGDYGKGYALVDSAWQRGIVGLTQLGKGIVFISHAVDREVVARNMKYTRTMPSAPRGCHKVLNPLVDFQAYIGFGSDDVKKRVMVFEPKENLECKDRFGKFPAEVVLPKTGQYQALQNAWNGVKPAPKMVSAAKKV